MYELKKGAKTDRKGAKMDKRATHVQPIGPHMCSPHKSNMASANKERSGACQLAKNGNCQLLSSGPRHFLSIHQSHTIDPTATRYFSLNVITTNESQIKNLKESDNEINEKSNEKRVEIAKIPPTPPKEEVVKEVEKEATYILPPPYNPPIPFTQRLVEANVESQSKRDVEELKNINTNAPLYEIPYKKRNLEDNREIISVKKGRLDFEVANEEDKPRPEKLIIKIDPEPPPHVQTSEPPYRKKKIKSEGYGRWVDKWRWKPRLIRSLIGDS
ncbi:unnamed protein product [Trifolium pratense]|uniref:Uncharacterized protein n=1 Tax=Trifolium pratense TaxID=57577 RepID=A0ACB0JI00_TRIPR|nr:unnamed protein product [Trifolium pratense]